MFLNPRVNQTTLNNPMVPKPLFKPMKSRILTPARSAVAALACVAALASNAPAQTTNSWVNNNSGVWSDSLNWTNPPTDGAAYATNLLRFSGSTNYFSTNDFTTSVPFQLFGIVFNNVGAATNGNAVNLSGGALQFLANGSVTPFITNQGISAVNIGNDIDISATNLTFGGNGGILTVGGVISGAANVTKAGSHTNVFTMQNTYSGDTVIQAGLLRGIVTNNNSTVFGTSSTIRPQGGTVAFLTDTTNVTLGLGSGYNVVQASGNNGVILVDRLTTATSNLVFRLNTATVTNSSLGITANNGSQLIFDGATSVGGTAAVFNVTAGLASLNGAISELNANTAFRKIGGGRLAITNGLIPAYTGLTLVDAGQLQVNSTVAAPSPLPGTDIYLRGGTIEFRTTNSQVVGPGAGYNFMVTANGSTINSDRIPTSLASSGTNTIVLNNITFAPNSVGLGVALTSVGTNLTFTTGSSNTIRVVGTTTLATNTQLSVGGLTIIDGLITDTNGGLGTPFSLRKTGAGRLFITNTAVSNLYAGGTIVEQGFLQVNATSNNPANLGSGNLTLRGGTLEIRTTNSQAFGPGAGYAVTVITNSTISVDRFGTAATGNNIDLGPVTVSQVSTTATTLTINGANAYTLRVPSISFNTNLTLAIAATNLIVTGSLAESGGSFSLTKTGVGRLTLTNGVDQSYTGGTFINGGFVQVSAVTNNPQPLGTGIVGLNGGTLELRSDLNTTWGSGLGYNLRVTNGGGTVDLNRINTTGGSNVFFVNNIEITTNTGTLTVTGNNSDVLMLNGSVVGSVSGVPQYTLSSSAANNVISNNIIQITGNGALVFTNQFTFKGSNSVSGLRILDTTTFADSVTDHILNTPAGTLIFAGAVTNDGVNPITSFTHVGGGTAVFSNTVTLGTATRVTNNAGAMQFFGTNNVMVAPTINAGSILGNGGQAQNNEPFGKGPIIINGGTVQYRTDNSNNLTIGAGAGYTNIVNSNATINVDRTFAAGASDTIRIGELQINSSRLAITGGNSYRFQNNGSTIIDGKVFLGANSAQITLAGQISEASPGAILIKEGASNLFYTSLQSATHTGGTIITNGSSVFWRPVNLPATNGGVPATYQFGSGAIVLDGNATFNFQPNTTSNYTFTTPYQTADKVAVGQVTGDGGGQLNYNSVANSPVTTNTGAITLAGTLRINGAGNNGSTTPMINTGVVTITGDNREITALNRANTGNDRYIFRGNITGDGTYSNLTLRANQFGAIELGQTGTGNRGVNDIYIAPSYQGANGRIRFATSNSLPGGKVIVDSGTAVAIGFNSTNFNGLVNTGISGLGTKFTFLPDSVLALEGVKPQTSVAIDLSAAGLNADIRLGAFEGANVTITNAITPFASTYKLAGGNGTLLLATNNQLTGANSLIVNPNPFTAPVAALTAGTLDFSSAAASNTFSGGTVQNGGTMIIRAGRTNTPLGTGSVDTYGTLQALGAGGSFAGPDGLTNNNSVRLQPGSTLQLGETASFTGNGTNRWGDNTDMSLMASRLTLVGRNIANATNIETIGNLNYALGSRLNIQAQPNSNNNFTILAANSLTRMGNGTLALLRNNNANPITNDVSFGGASRIVATVAPTVNNGMIAPNIYNETENVFVTYDSTIAGPSAVGITNAAFTATGTDINTAAATDIYQLSSAIFGTNAITGAATVNALKVVSNNVTSGGGTLTITSGGLITVGNVTNSAPLLFGAAGAGEGVILNANNLVLQGDITAALGVTKANAGTLILQSNRTYANGWNINWGTVQVSSSNALGTSVAGNAINLNNGQNTVNLTFNQNAAGVSYTSGPINNYDNNTIAFAFGAADRVHTFGPMGLTMNTYSSGPLGSRLRLTMDQARSRAVLGGNLTVNTDSYLDVSASTVVTGSSNRIDVAGNLVGAGKSLTKYGNGSLGLISDNSSTWTGGRITNLFGALHVANDGALGDINSTVVIKSNAVLQLASSVVMFNPAAGVTMDPGSAERWLGAFNQFNNNTSSEIYTVLSDRNLQVSIDMTAVTNKTIRLSSNAGLEGYQFAEDTRANTITLGRSMTVDLAGNAKIGQSGVDIGRSGTQMNVLANVTESGGSRSLTKIGLDIVNLQGSNTYSGGTRVQRGTLLVNNGFQSVLTTNQGAVYATSATATNGSATGSGAVSVASQAMLGGSGAISGNVTVETGATLMPNTQGTIGTMLIEGNLTFQIGSMFDIDINATNSSDSVIVKGNVDLGGATLGVRLGANIPLTATNMFVLVNNLGANAVANSFAGLADGSLIQFAGNDSTNNNFGYFQLHINDPAYLDGNDVVLTVAVPEPGTAALMVIGAALCGLHVMRRRRN